MTFMFYQTKVTEYQDRLLTEQNLQHRQKDRKTYLLVDNLSWFCSQMKRLDSF